MSNQNSQPGQPDSADNSSAEIARNIEKMQEMFSDIASNWQSPAADPFNLGAAGAAWMEALSRNPEKMIQAGMKYWQDTMALYHQSAMAIMGHESSPVVTEEKGDRRFRHEAWEEQPAFNLIKQSYLLAARWAREISTDVEGLDSQAAEKIAFFTERYMDSLSPTNFAATNPAVIHKTIESRGANLVSGMENMLDDLKKGDGTLRISMTDTEAFELGKNVATTPGKVVFRNRMLELLQYEPSTEKTFSKPLLVIPPWINKYYVLDLQPENSLIKWLVSKGHTVFVVSWVNPDSSYRDTTFDDYVIDGVGACLDAIEQATGQKQVNAIGYCIGGALLATALAYHKVTGDTRV